MWCSVVCTLIDNNTHDTSSQWPKCFGLTRRSRVRQILTTVMTRIVVDKSTDHAKPHFDSFLPQHQRQRTCLFSSNCGKNMYRYYLYKSFFCLEFHLVFDEPLGQTSSFIYLHYEKQRVTLPLPVPISTWWNESMTSKNTRILEFLVRFNRPFPSCLLPLCRTSLHVKMERYLTVLNFISIFLFTGMSFL